MEARKAYSRAFAELRIRQTNAPVPELGQKFAAAV